MQPRSKKLGADNCSESNRPTPIWYVLEIWIWAACAKFTKNIEPTKRVLRNSARWRKDYERENHDSPDRSTKLQRNPYGFLGFFRNESFLVEKFVLVGGSNPGQTPVRGVRSANWANQEASDWQREGELVNNSKHVRRKVSSAEFRKIE